MYATESIAFLGAEIWNLVPKKIYLFILFIYLFIYLFYLFIYFIYVFIYLLILWLT